MLFKVHDCGKHVFITAGNELDDGKEAFKIFAIYYLHEPENLKSIEYYSFLNIHLPEEEK